MHSWLTVWTKHYAQPVSPFIKPVAAHAHFLIFTAGMQHLKRQ